MGSEQLEQRMARAEQNIGTLTQNVGRLTSDVDRMVKAQEQTITLISQQAEQSSDMKHFSNSLERCFNRLEDVEKDTQELKTHQEVASAVSDTRIGAAKFVLRYWYLIAGIGLVGYQAKALLG